MKSKKTLVSIAAVVLAMWVTFEYGHAASTSATPVAKIGLVSVRNVINGTQHQAKYRNTLVTRQTQMNAELESLNKAVEAAQAELNTMRQGTEDYINQYQVVLQKRSQLENQQDVFTQQRNLEDKLWFEKLYQATLDIVKQLAQEQGLDIVLERTEPEFPMQSEALMATLQNHKVLYSGNCPDLTGEVLRRLDALDSLKP